MRLLITGQQVTRPGTLPPTYGVRRWLKSRTASRRGGSSDAALWRNLAALVRGLGPTTDLRVRATADV
ncbi:hypothetical protein AB0D67_38605 [Streptosporangium sp. NPDC048047]|uniref:hypothetical protein n=1 Tax=Streptosporangium sp. NPDC048047 TaxID=3155748 RepID=UPI0034355905